MGVSTDGLLFWGIAYGEEYEDHWEREQGYGWLDELEQQHPGIEFGTHGADDYTLPYISVKELSAFANRGYPQDVTKLLEALERGEQGQWYDRLKTAVAATELPWQEPVLTLASWWG